MGRRNESPEKKKRRALIAELLKDTPVKDGEDVNALMRAAVRGAGKRPARRTRL